MQIHHSQRLYSASDLVAFMGCRHRSTLDLRKLEGWEVDRVEADAASRLVQEYGNRHERAYLDLLRGRGLRIAEIDSKASLPDRIDATRAAMTSGMDVIFQAALLRAPFVGYADFLVRVPGASRLGDFHYEIADTKLAKSNRAKFMVQLCFYADLLETEQGVLPRNLHVVLGQLDARERVLRGLVAGQDHVVKLPTVEYIHHVRAVQADFLAFMAEPAATKPFPNPSCGHCGWREHCEQQWQAVDHLSAVAGIRADQIGKLESAGVATLHALAAHAGDVKGISRHALQRLKQQAELQCRPLDEQGRRRLALREAPPPRRRDQAPPPWGLGLLPKPDAGDLYFDMEGFPHEPGGLEYLFGIGYFENGDRQRWNFRAFWAHDRAQEKQAFEAFMDFVQAHLARFPLAHIYHYAPYEKTAIQRLSSVHDTRCDFRDRLLREGRLVDLYRVVQSGLLLALPSYSIKQVESYYRGKRSGEVANAGDSIVQYEAYRLADDEVTKARLLGDIERYNRDDVESTQQLHDWLERLRSPDTPRPQAPAPTEELPAAVSAREEREAAARAALEAWVQQQPDDLAPRARQLADILSQLLGFYWRCKLANLWRHYERQEKEEHELLDDAECLALLERCGEGTPVKRSLRYTYRVPPQESKLSSGMSVRCLTDGLQASNFEYDERAGLVSFTRVISAEEPPHTLTLCLYDNIDDDPKLDAIYRFVARVCGGDETGSAVTRMLTREAPAVSGTELGGAVAPDATTASIIDTVRRLEHSHLVIQGPPGTGKTTQAAQVIATLLKDGKSVAITSNSHAAINHLLKAAYVRAKTSGAAVDAVVVKRDEDLSPGIRPIDPKDLDATVHRLAGGTAWLFSRSAQTHRWDYLFIDEASQVSLADALAAKCCARNIVLLGDQMQLPQPTEGTHPGESGLSVLDYLMQGHATVPPELGIFLGQTHRMHPDVCRPISEGVYEGRLSSAPECARQRLLLDDGADPALRPSGMIWVPVPHQDCRQRSEPEALRIQTLYRSLLGQRWVDRDGRTWPLTAQDIVIVAPYNAQVQLLRRTLGDGARVGTVDKFQGQEAAVAIFSMTTSDAENMPRGLDFLFSRNRLNVGVSRAKCLALIVASPALRTMACQKVEDMALLSFYARLTATVASDFCVRPKHELETTA